MNNVHAHCACLKIDTCMEIPFLVTKRDNLFPNFSSLKMVITYKKGYVVG